MKSLVFIDCLQKKYALFHIATKMTPIKTLVSAPLRTRLINIFNYCDFSECRRHNEHYSSAELILMAV